MAHMPNEVLRTCEQSISWARVVGELSGVPERIRTSDLWIVSPVADLPQPQPNCLTLKKLWR